MSFLIIIDLQNNCRNAQTYNSHLLVYYMFIMSSFHTEMLHFISIM